MSFLVSVQKFLKAFKKYLDIEEANPDV